MVNLIHYGRSLRTEFQFHQSSTVIKKTHLHRPHRTNSIEIKIQIQIWSKLHIRSYGSFLGQSLNVLFQVEKHLGHAYPYPYPTPMVNTLDGD